MLIEFFGLFAAICPVLRTNCMGLASFNKKGFNSKIKKINLSTICNW